MPDQSTADKRRTFHELHRGGCFVIPNPWDLGSLRYLEALGFKALATTSSGFAWSQGLPDYGVTREAVLSHLARLAEATDLPINSDFQSGFGHDAQSVIESVRLAVDTGVAGLSIEDSTGDANKPLYDMDVAVERIRAARKAIDGKGGDTLLVARAECLLVGRTDLEEVIARLQAYSRVGADCLYAPGVRSAEQITRVVHAVAPKPVNVLMGSTATLSVSEIAALGVRRISVGGALARTAWTGFIRAAALLAHEGKFDGFLGAVGGDTLNTLMRSDPRHP